jgi:histidinol phosphatase-like PHP family hydrolase
LDYVIASQHTTYKDKNFKNIKEAILYAINNPEVDVIGHPDEYIGLKNNWDLFRENFKEADEFHKKMTEFQKDKKKNNDELEKMYKFIRMVIGKDKIEGENLKNEELSKFRGEFEKMSIPYWEMWEEILTAMAEKGKAFEINLKSPPDDKLLEMAASKNIKFMLNFDTHDFSQFKQETDFIKRGKSAKRRWARGDAKDEDMEALEKYKEASLTSGPGFMAIRRLVKTIIKLEGWGVTPDRIVNSSRENMINFLTKDRGKSTDNLEFLKNKFIKE